MDKQSIIDYRNPYLDAIRNYVDANTIIKSFCEQNRFDEAGAFEREYGSFANYEARRKFVMLYSWAIPNEEALTTIAKYAPIVEVGAGTGYWAYMLRNRGVDIIAYDANPPTKSSKHNRYHPEQDTWTEVLRGDSKVAACHTDCTLFLCWAPMGHMAHETINAYQGDTVIYVGEGAYGCTGGIETLEESWDQIEELAIPQWDGIHDTLTVWRRR